MNYSNEFIKAFNFAEKEKLFLGYGNPNAKILILGKEHYFNNKSKPGSDEYYDEVLKAREDENLNNVNGWKNNIASQTEPIWNTEHPIENSNPLFAWGSQFNKAHKKLKNGAFNGGTSSTYLKYQKLHQYLSLKGKKSERINFQKEFFLSELNDLPSKVSYKFPRLDNLRREFIGQRSELFRHRYFREFPIVIIAAGHYPKDNEFDIEEVFQTNFMNKIEAGNSWLNIHISNDKKRLLIHTRQLSTSVSDDLLIKIAESIESFTN